MASFISKLTKECNNCEKIIDRCSIKNIRFESDMSTSHQILGPLFKATVPSPITKLFEENCRSFLLQGFEWSRWDLAKPQGSWPSTTTAWASWVVRMEKHFGEQWKGLGIYDAIRLSSMELAVDKELLMAALSFWCSATNSMVLPLGPMGPTVLDVTAILGTSPFGLPIDVALSGYPSHLDLKSLFEKRAFETLGGEDQAPSKDKVQKLYKNFFNYNTLYLHFAGKGEEGLREGEHEAFLFYWYNKYICCTKSNKCLVENMPVAEALASGHTLALSPAILAHLFRCLAEMTLRKVDPHQTGPLWVFQLWLQVYFAALRSEIAEFSPSTALGPQLASRPTSPHKAEEVFKFFFTLEDLSDDEFLICRRRDYPSSIPLPTSAWGADEDGNLRQSWGSFILARDLPLGCDAHRAGWEVYHPNFTARQLGYLQGCPVPLLSSRSALNRGREPGSSEKECKNASREFQERCQQFRLRPAVPEALCTDTFGDWWEEYTHDFFSVPVEDVVHRLFGGRPSKAPVSQPKDTAQGSRAAKGVDVVAPDAAGKKLVPPSKLSKRLRQESELVVGTLRPSAAGKTLVPSSKLAKRPRQESELGVGTRRPSKRIKQTAKKGEREIHVVSS